MPTIDEAVERAARAAWALEEPCIAWDSLEPSDHAHLINVQRAALSAFFADVPVSEGMVDAGRKANTFALPVCYKAMSAELAEEIK